MNGRKKFPSGLFQTLFMTCEEATYIISKEDINPTPWIKKFHLRIHLLTCNYCSRFRKQIRLINTLLTYKKPDQSIPQPFKVNLERKISELIKKENGTE